MRLLPWGIRKGGWTRCEVAQLSPIRFDQAFRSKQRRFSHLTRSRGYRRQDRKIGPWHEGYARVGRSIYAGNDKPGVRRLGVEGMGRSYRPTAYLGFGRVYFNIATSDAPESLSPFTECAVGSFDMSGGHQKEPRGRRADMAHSPIKEGANADLTCGRKPRVLHRDGTCLNSDAGATHKATRRACSLACPITRQPMCRLTFPRPFGLGETALRAPCANISAFALGLAQRRRFWLLASLI